MDMNQLIESIYASSAAENSLEKTAEQRFLGDIELPSADTEENPFSSLSLDELVKLAQDLETEDSVEEAPVEEAPVESDSDEVSEEDLNKTAAAMFGGQLMAHSVVHELGLIKEAVANGICRVCKQNPFDVEGSSICSACSEG